MLGLKKYHIPFRNPLKVLNINLIHTDNIIRFVHSSNISLLDMVGKLTNKSFGVARSTKFEILKKTVNSSSLLVQFFKYSPQLKEKPKSCYANTDLPKREKFVNKTLLFPSDMRLI